nr:MAG TPA: Honey bee toxin [Caudoviricetes sp.]
MASFYFSVILIISYFAEKSRLIREIRIITPVGTRNLTMV